MRVRETLTSEERRAKVVEILARGILRLAAAKTRKPRRRPDIARDGATGRPHISASSSGDMP